MQFILQGSTLRMPVFIDALRVAMKSRLLVVTSCHLKTTPSTAPAPELYDGSWLFMLNRSSIDRIM